MAIAPLPGTDAKTLLDELRRLSTELGNVPGAGNAGLDLFNRYDDWATSASRRLGSMVRSDDLQHLVESRRYWALQSMNVDGRPPAALNHFVQLEIDERAKALSDAGDDLEREMKRWSSDRSLIVVPDTNIYLHHDCLFPAVPWETLVPALLEGVHLVVPLIVVDELDRRKRSARNEKVSERNNDLVRTRARLTLRALDKHLQDPRLRTTLRRRSQDAGELSLELLLDPPGHERVADADQEIVDRAVALQSVSGKSVYLLTFDTGMRIRARAAGLEARLLSDDNTEGQEGSA
jgi:hypothetical protein